MVRYRKISRFLIKMLKKGNFDLTWNLDSNKEGAEGVFYEQY